MQEDLPRYHDVKARLMREAETNLPPGTSLIPASVIAEVEEEARNWTAAAMILAGSPAVDIADELGLSLPSVQRLRANPAVSALVNQMRAEMDRAIQDKLAGASIRSISALENIRDDSNVGAEHRVKAGLGILGSYQDRAAKESAKGGNTTNIAILLQQGAEKAAALPVVEIEDIRGSNKG